MSEQRCPVCGVGFIRKSISMIPIEDPILGASSIETSIYSCPACGSEGDFFGENEKAIKDAYESLKSDSVSYMVTQLASSGVRLAAAERTLGLPQRTMSKWKNKSMTPSAGAVALIRFIYLFPWLLKVADSGFESEAAVSILMQEATKLSTEAPGPKGE